MRQAIRKAIIAAAAITGIGAGAAWADFPERQITIIVPYAAGGNVDLTARAVAQSMQKILGKPVVVENKPGATGSVGATYVARSKPDGYTILAGSNGPLSTNAALGTDLPYDPMNDFRSIGLISKTPLVVSVTPAFPPQSLAEMIEYSKANQVRAGIGGVGQSTDIALRKFNELAGLEMLMVPYAGQGELYPDLIAGNIDLTFDQITASMPMYNNEQIRILAVASKERSPLLPDVPTVDESGFPGYEAASYVGLVVPAATPDDVANVLIDALAEAIMTDEVKGALEQRGAIVRPSQPQELFDTAKADYEMTKGVLEKSK